MIKPIENYNGLSITFHVTTDCNLRCKYCYEIDKEPGVLQLNYAKKFIDIILNDPNPIGIKDEKKMWILNNGLILDFIGGDALMVPELCDDILTYYIYKSMMMKHKWAGRWRASISSNGTFFNDKKVRKFLLKYNKNISLGVSVDGCPEIHNSNRSNSMDEILKGWNWYQQYCSLGDTHPVTKSTCNKESIPYLYESVKFLHEILQLSYINMNFIFEEMNLTEIDYQILNDQLGKITEYILNHHNDLYFSMLDKGFTIGKKMDNPEGSWCGSGSMPCLALDGKIYPCFRFLPTTMGDEKYDFNVGDIWNGINKEKFIEIQENNKRKVVSKPECLNCNIETTCSWCIGGAYSQNGKFWRGTSNCRINQIRDKWARIYWNEYNKFKGIPERYETVDYSNCIECGEI